MNVDDVDDVSTSFPESGRRGLGQKQWRFEILQTLASIRRVLRPILVPRLQRRGSGFPRLLPVRATPPQSLRRCAVPRR
jgi:hypothetical protein